MRPPFGLPEIIDEELTPTRRSVLALMGMTAAAAALGAASLDLTLAENGIGMLVAELRSCGALPALAELAAYPEIAGISLFEAEDAITTALTAGSGRPLQRYAAAVSADAARGRFADVAGVLMPYIAAALARLVGGKHPA